MSPRRQLRHRESVPRGTWPALRKKATPSSRRIALAVRREKRHHHKANQKNIRNFSCHARRVPASCPYPQAYACSCELWPWRPTSNKIAGSSDQRRHRRMGGKPATIFDQIAQGPMSIARPLPARVPEAIPKVRRGGMPVTALRRHCCRRDAVWLAGRPH
jgi:hypothetical protein